MCLTHFPLFLSRRTHEEVRDKRRREDKLAGPSNPFFIFVFVALRGPPSKSGPYGHPGNVVHLGMVLMIDTGNVPPE